jgi:flagellar basal body rod protein FlgG
MFQPLHTGRLGLSGQQRNVDVIGNNIANINVTGFKRSRQDFQDNLYTRMYNKADSGVHMNLQRGVGMRPYQTPFIMEQGEIHTTGRSLDFALEDPGFFMIQNPNPIDEYGLDEIIYTRNGTFYLSAEDPEAFLVDAFGRYVLDVNGDRIVIPNANELLCEPGGLLYIIDENDGIVPVAQLGFADFVNPGGLAAIGESSYMRTANSGDLLEDISMVVRQGFVEASNVDFAEEMIRIVRAQRAYQLAARAVTTADQMLQTANAIRS